MGSGPINLWLISPQPIPFLWKDLNNGLRIHSEVFNLNFLLKPHSVQLSLLALDFASASRSPDFTLSILWGSSCQGWDCIGSASIAPLYHGRHRSLHLDQIWLILGVSVIQVSSGNLRKLCPYRLRVPYPKCFPLNEVQISVLVLGGGVLAQLPVGLPTHTTN